VFVVSAAADPGTAEAPGAPLERLQIVKVWLEGDDVREAVFDVATGEPVAADAACGIPQAGSRTLCARWHDESFDDAAAALYYVRVVEVPTCRWTTIVCREHGVDCEAERPSGDLAVCCDASVPRMVNERAWTSPIWYTPETVPGSGP
jgi:hypothetical protein